MSEIADRPGEKFMRGRSGAGHKLEFPMCMRPASLDERKEFYSREFDLKKVEDWLKGYPPMVFSVIIGRYTQIFPREYARIKDNTMIIYDYRDLADLRDYILQYRPESVYYDRSLYKNRKICHLCGKKKPDCWSCEGFIGQELAFDLDVENVYCPLHGEPEERVKADDYVSFCEYELEMIREKAIELLDEIRSEYSDVKVTYSGRGYHVHVRDRRAFLMSRKERKEFARQIGHRYPIDEWVTEGESHLIRLPFSLNGLVSRIVLPLRENQLWHFDPVTNGRCIPDFVRTHRP